MDEAENRPVSAFGLRPSNAVGSLHEADLSGILPATAMLPYTFATVPTPALVVDAAVVQRNIDRMAEYARQHGLHLRPHTKTHKSKFLAQHQLDGGAVGLTVAKVGEAQVMADLGAELLLAYPPVDRPRCEKLTQLADAGRILVALDSTYAADALAADAKRAGVQIGILIDLDVGMGRTGVQSADDALKLAQHVDRLDNVTVEGLFCFPGHLFMPPAEQGEALSQVADRLDQAIDLWKRHGLSTRIVSGGSTPTAFQSHHVKAYTEIRPGTYIFFDMNSVHGGVCELADCAARVVCTVVSDAVPNQVVIDAGSKALAADRCVPAPDRGHGYVVEYPEAHMKALSEEHGWVDVSRCERRPQVGERITVIPNHICPCVNLQDRMWLLRDADEPLESLRVDGRGKLS